MGRYTTIQAFADNNPGMAKLPYDEAALASSKTTDEKTGNFGTGVTVEKVNNVMGSTAGAGSGEYHMYRHGRRRERERIAAMERGAEELQKHEEFESRVDAKRKECEDRTRKNAQKRKKRRAKQAGANGNAFTKMAAEGTKAAEDSESDVSDSEFKKYEPASKAAAAAEVTDATKDLAASTAKTVITVEEVLDAVVENDGSFLARAKALLASNSA